MAPPLILGLTGSIGTGKSTVATMFRRLKVPVIDADQVVHQLYETCLPLAEKLSSYAPHLLKDGKVNRTSLGQLVFEDPSFLPCLEGLVHPFVKQVLLEEIEAAKQAKVPLLVLEVPLLFEAGFEALCDLVLVVHTPLQLQYQRVLKRPLMTSEKLAFVLERQLPQQEKIKRADFTLDTSRPRVHIFKDVVKLCEKVCQTHA